MRIELQPAYLLHSRKVSDSRLVVDFITRDYGLVSAMARAPTKKQSPMALFRPVFISWLGNKELKTLTLYELAAVAMPVLEGKSLFCGFYLNELLMRLLNKADGSSSLYAAYQSTLLHLPSANSVEPLLRRFERILLDEAGFAIDWHCDTTGAKIVPACLYRLRLNAGFERVNGKVKMAEQFSSAQTVAPKAASTQTADFQTTNPEAANPEVTNPEVTNPEATNLEVTSPEATNPQAAHSQNSHFYTGADLIALAAHQYDSTRVQLAAKKIMRQLLAQRLGGKPLKSRELFLS